MYHLMGRMRYYHATPKRFRYGDFITGYRGVFLTTDPMPHFTVMYRAWSQNLHIYEVEPDKKLIKGMWCDLWTPNARVIRYIGRARGVIKTQLGTRADGMIQEYDYMIDSRGGHAYGSKVFTQGMSIRDGVPKPRRDR